MFHSIEAKYQNNNYYRLNSWTCQNIQMLYQSKQENGTSFI